MAIAILTRLFITQGFVFVILKTGDTSGDCELWNAALCKPSNQTDVFTPGSPDRAVDGDRNPEFKGHSCVHTISDVDTWWMVDLMDEYLVHKIVITNRADGFTSRFALVFVDLFLSDPSQGSGFPVNAGTPCTYVITAFEGTKSFDCFTPTYARYVKLLKRSHSILNFCELEVMVSQKRGDAVCRKTVSKSFDIKRNHIVENGQSVLNTTTNTALRCVQLCAQNSYLCNGCFWTEDARDCQMLNVDLNNMGQIVNKEGTDFYVQSLCG